MTNESAEVAQNDVYKSLTEAVDFFRNIETPKYPTVFMWNGKVYDADKLTKLDAAELLALFKS